jgi:hypothetical protein
MQFLLLSCFRMSGRLCDYTGQLYFWPPYLCLCSFSYAARTSPTYDPYRKSQSKSRSRSRSHSPINSGQITYITSFGGEEESTDEGGRLPSSKFLTSSSSSSSHSANVVVAPQNKASRSVYKLNQDITGQTSFVLVPYIFVWSNRMENSYIP